ncbi:MAG: Lrp/AsnC family transcriptional regulator [Halieaceae bacterium]
MPDIDRIDRRIIAELQHDGGLSNLELSERVGLSPSPCLRRVKQLEEAGIIRRRVTIMDQEALGLSLTVFVQVSLGNQVPGMLEHFEEKVATYPEVLECSLVTGSDADYLLKAVIPDMSHYERFLLRELNQIDGVSHIRTSFALRRVVNRTELPLTHLA